ncbi:MAG: hypothetical protein BGO39_13360 [Chloroflexi bacterium 54-19]|nr:MAG: hypothetical protein BGO39_13360 [Chloroflexi bacterium 54-19]
MNIERVEKTAAVERKVDQQGHHVYRAKVARLKQAQWHHGVRLSQLHPDKKDQGDYPGDQADQDQPIGPTRYRPLNQAVDNPAQAYHP